jgi:hypothetical protein
MTTIPSGDITELLDNWRSLTDQTYEIFGLECDIVYLKRNVEYVPSVDENLLRLNTINSKRVPVDPSSYNNGGFKSEEVTEKIRVKIYWTEKEWSKIFGLTAVPVGHVVILSMLEDSNRMNISTEIRYTDKFDNTYSFSRSGKVIPYGFQRDRYGYSIWKQM